MPGSWHNEMEAQFCARGCAKEVKFGNRRADILLSSKFTCEIQKKLLDLREVSARKRDYAAHDKTIIWILEGVDTIHEKLSNGSYILELKHTWQYRSYRDAGYKFIILCIADKFFKIELSMIRGRIITVRGHETLENVITRLVDDPNNIWSLWSDDYTEKATMTMIQQGAGNGKTYWIWESICNNEDKDTYLLITKMKSATEVMYNELVDQEDRGVFHITNLEELKHNVSKSPNHYVIKYTHKISGRKCTVIIGTIDSFMYNTGNRDNSYGDMFEYIRKGIIANGMDKTKVNPFGTIDSGWGGEGVKLNKRTMVMCDESQDLPTSYGFAMMRAMLDTGFDMTYVGDRLQSLGCEENIFVEMARGRTGVQGITLITPLPVDNNRRCKSIGLCDFRKKVGDFVIDGLPEPTPLHETEDNGNPVEIIYYDNEDDGCEKWMEKYELHVNRDNFKSNDFMNVSPVMVYNTFAQKLLTFVNNFWKKRCEAGGAQLHKSIECQPIDLKESRDATRIVSTYTAKGDGRNVVMCTGFTERSLMAVSRDSDGNPSMNLCYRSHFNVGMSRAVRYQYVFLKSDQDDEVSRRFEGAGLCKPRLPKSTRCTQSHILADNLASTRNGIFVNDNNERPVDPVEWGHHCIKRSVYIFEMITQFSRGEYSNFIMDHLKNCEIITHTPNGYWKLFNKQNPSGGVNIILLMKYDNDNTIKIIRSTVKYVIANWHDPNKTFTIYQRIVSVWLFKWIKHGQYTDFNMSDLHDVTNKLKTDNNHSTKEEMLYGQLENINSLVKELRDYIPEKVNWMIEETIWYDGKTHTFGIITDNLECIGFDSDNVYHIAFVTDMNSMNQDGIIKSCIANRFNIYNSTDSRYNGKNIKTYVVMLKTNYIRELTLPEPGNMESVSEIRDALVKKYSAYHKTINTYFMYIKDRPDIWKEDGYTTPFEMIYVFYKNIKKYPYYLTQFFMNLHEKWQMGEKVEVKAMYPELIAHLDTKLKLAVDDYMGLTEQVDEDF